MLSCYPIEATHENWLHEAIILLVSAIHQKLDANKSIPNKANTWNNLIQAITDEEKREKIKPLTGVRDRLFAYKDELQKLTQPQRQEVLEAMKSQNKIVELLNSTEPRNLIKQNYPELHEKAKALFVFCFEKLTDLGVRNRQYEIIFKSLPNKICPFCGIERVMNPEETAQDQDHYLAKSIYPFAAANMRNLVPICRCCNRDYKKDIDILVDAHGAVREAFDPYDCTPTKITLDNSELIPDSYPIAFDWNIQFLDNVQKAGTWDAVFSIRERYKRDVLEQYFDNWLRGFTEKCERERARENINIDSTHQQIREQLKYYQEDIEAKPNIGLAGFLEPLAFNVLLKLFDEGNERIINLIRDAVLGIRMEELT